jgi:hypothetical protein
MAGAFTNPRLMMRYSAWREILQSVLLLIMRWEERRGWLDGLVVGVLYRSSSGSTMGREWVCCLVKDSGSSGFFDGTGHRSWTGL